VEAARPRWKDEPEAKGIAIEVSAELGDVGQARGTPTGLSFLQNLFALGRCGGSPSGAGDEMGDR